MTRLPGRLVPGRAQNSSARSKFRKHKVILESVTQKRKKLRTIVSYLEPFVFHECIIELGYSYHSKQRHLLVTLSYQPATRHSQQPARSSAVNRALKFTLSR